MLKATIHATDSVPHQTQSYQKFNVSVFKALTPKPNNKLGKVNFS